MSVALALLPVAATIALGWVLKNRGFLAEAGWAALDRLVYFVLFPSLLFLELARAPLAGQPVVAFGVTVLTAQLAMALLARLLKRPLGLGGPAFTSVFQTVARWNSYVALALTASLFGREGLPLTAIAVAVMVPTGNVISVLALARHGTATTTGPRALVRAVVTNPLILASLGGAAWNATGVPLPYLAAEVLGLLGRATLALGLLSVGAGLMLSAMTTRPLVLLVAAALKLLLKPLMAFLVGRLLGLDGTALGVAVLVAAVPTSTTAYILARLLGGDAELMAALITVTTLAAMLTLPLVLATLAG